MKELLGKEIKSVLEGFGVENPNVILDYPTQFKLGDYSSNVSMMYAKELGKNPTDLAEEIKNKLEGKKIKHLEKIEAVKPGFINFFFDEEYFAEALKKIHKNKTLSGQKIFIEHTQPNPFKEFHIGHLMNNSIGESIVRIIKENGANTKVASYHGDVGLHVAKAILGVINLEKKALLSEEDSLKDRVMFLGSAYAIGSDTYESSEGWKEKVIEINKKIYDKSDAKINELYEWGRKISLDYFESLYKKLDSHFDYHFYESQAGEVGKKIVMECLGKIFEESQGAIVFKGENFLPKTHTRVFLTKDKLPTYEAKELGIAKIKNDKFDYDKSVTVTASEQDAFFTVVEVATGEVFPELKGRLKHLSHGMIRLPEGKMSSRTGNIISAESLINQVKEKIISKHETEDSVAEEIAIGAIKYSILRQAIGGDIIFDFDKSISFEGDSGPYLQYSVVRANSLLQKSEGVVEMSEKLPQDWETTNLERLLERFPGVVARAGTEYAPHHIVTYLIDLAGEFNSFYASHKIIDSADLTSPYRLALTQAFAEVMTSGLNLLGIKVPSRM